MTVFRSDRAFVDLCMEMLHDDGSCNLLLHVPGSGMAPIAVHQAFVCQLGPLLRECLHSLGGGGPDVEAALLFPEFSVDEVKTLVRFLYRGEEGRISQSLAQAMGLTAGGHGIKGLLRNSRRPQAMATSAAIAAASYYSDEDDKNEVTKAKVLPACGDNGTVGEPGKFEADIKLELADYDDNEDGGCNGGGGGGMIGGGGNLKMFQPKCELSEDQQQQYWQHWNKMAVMAAAAAADGETETKKRGVRKRSLRVEVKHEEDDEEEWENEAVRRKKRKRKQHRATAGLSGSSSTLPKSKLVEYHQMTERLRLEPERFRLFNRGYYWGTCRNRKPTETEEEFMARIALYEKFPGLIIDDEITRFNVCVECGVVTKNLSSGHRCQRQVDFLRDRPVEMFRRIQKSAHLSKYFKQKAEKALCLVCTTLCPSIDAFQVHLKEEHNVEPLLYKANNMYGDYVCQECGKRLVNMNLLRQHEINKHAKIELARAKCEDCSAYFATINLYHKHIKTVHEDYRPHVCEDCARSFKVKKHLESHRRTHTGEKSFQCRHCEKSFAKEWTRTQHERLHLGLKPYQCDICDAKYSQKTSLDCHVRSHHKSA